LFIAFAILSYHIKVFKIWGAEGTFFAYSFFGPLPSAFLGPVFGIISIISSQLLHRVIEGKTLFSSLFGLARFFIMPITSLYFAYYNKTKLVSLIPLLFFILFVIHPSSSIFYALYWLIPILSPFISKNLFFRSLSTTFVAHAVGSTAFIYLIKSTPEFWISLIPIVALERLTFGVGIAFSYLLFTNLLNALFPYKSTDLFIDKKYVLRLQ